MSDENNSPADESSRLARKPLFSTEQPQPSHPRTGGGAPQWQPPTVAELQALLPAYEIIELLGHGGMGAVYKAQQLTLQRIVAIKIVPIESFDDADTSFIERFKNEARTMGRMNHPGIVSVYDFGETAEGQLYFVMEYVDGTDVYKMIQSAGKLPSEHALAITAHVCDALTYAHGNGVIHRDIKPANILINQQGQIKVADFGLAKADTAGLNTGLTQANTTLGTPDFVAPEALVLGVTADHRADLYAVGVMLYNMLTGEIPRGVFQPPSVKAGCDPRFDNIVLMAMQTEREYRYQSAAKIRRDLDEILTTPMVKQAAEPPRPSKPVGRKPGAATGPTPRPSPSAAFQRSTPHQVESPISEYAEPVSAARKPWLIPAIAGGVSMLGLGAFVMFKPAPAPKEKEKLAVVAAATIDPKKETPPPASTSGESSLESDKDLPKLVKGKWTPVYRNQKELNEAAPGSTPNSRWDNGWFISADSKPPYFISTKIKNGGVRASFRRTKFAEEGGQIGVRSDTWYLGSYNLGFNSGGQMAISQLKILDSTKRTKESKNLLTASSLQPLDNNQKYTLELIAIGGKLIARFNGQLIGITNHSEWAEGRLNVSCREPLSDVEFLDLDGLGEKEALAIAGVDASGKDTRSPALAVNSTGNKFIPFPPLVTGKWRACYRTWEEIPEWARTGELPPTTEDGWIIPDPKKAIRLNAPSMKNGGVRARFRYAFGQADISSVIVRKKRIGNFDPEYCLVMNGKGQPFARFLQGPDKRDLTPLTAISPWKTGTEFSLELLAIGTKLIGRINGQLAFVTKDETLQDGAFAIWGAQPVRDIEFVKLDGVSETEALAIAGVDSNGVDTRAPVVAAVKPEAVTPVPQVPAPSATPTSAPAAPEASTTSASLSPELHQRLAALETGFAAAFQRDFQSQPDAGPRVLKEQYLKLLDDALKQAQSAARLKDALALKAESASVTAGQALPATDPKTTPDILIRLRAAYRGNQAKRVALYAKYEGAIDAVAAELTKAGKLDEAQLVIQRRAIVSRSKAQFVPGGETVSAAEATAPAPAATPKPAATPAPAATVAATTTPTAPVTTSTPTQNPPLGTSFAPTAATKGKGDDRAAAELLVNKGGWVDIESAGKVIKQIKKQDDLPKQTFEILVYGIERIDAPANNKTIDFSDEDFKIIANLRKVERILIKESKVTGATFDVLKTLPKLISINVDGPKFIDQANWIKITELPNLERFAVGKADFFGGNHGPTREVLSRIIQLPKLSALTVDDCTAFDNSLAPALASMKHLTTLNVGKSFTSKGLEELASCPHLETLAIKGSEIHQPVSFSKFSKLKKLDLLNVQTDDTTLSKSLSRCPAITDLRLESIALKTESVLKEIGELQSIKTLTLNTVELPPTAISALAKQSKLTTVNFTYDNNGTSLHACLKHLPAIKTLKNIGLPQTSQFKDRDLDQSVVTAFSKARPDVKINQPK